jgi:hypothetical protein
MDSNREREAGGKMESTGPAANSLPGKDMVPGESPSPDQGNREFILFRKIQGAMRYVPDFSETCKAILNAVMDEMEAENCSVMLQDPGSGELSVLAARGKGEKSTVYYSDSSYKGGRFRPGEGIAGWVL